MKGGNFLNNNCIEYESNSDKNKNLSVKEYLKEIKPYLKDIVNYLQKSDTCKVELTIATNFISSKDSKSDNIEVITYDNENEAIK